MQGNKVIDVIDFVMYKENLSKHEALLKAATLAGAGAEAGGISRKAIRSKEYQELPMDKLETVFTKMQNNLKQSCKGVCRKLGIGI